MTREKRAIAGLERTFGFPLQQHSLYILALTHSSFANEQKGQTGHNERLELLGDSVLGLCITEYLYSRFPERNEGQLAKLKSYIVSAESLAEAAREHGLGRFILLGKGESRDGGRDKESVLANVTEALIGACYLDQGLARANELILFLMKGQLERWQNAYYSPQDNKLRLQEHVQKHYGSLPQYQTKELAHSYGFETQIYIGEALICSGTGNSKKEAERQAAGRALERLTEYRHS